MHSSSKYFDSTPITITISEIQCFFISWKSWEKGRGSRTSRRPLSSAWIQSKKEGRISCLEPHLGGWMAEWIDSRFTLVESWWRRLLRRSHYSQDLQSDDGLWTSDLINLTGQIFHSSKSSRKGRNSSSDKRPWRRDWILSKKEMSPDDDDDEPCKFELATLNLETRSPCIYKSNLALFADS